MVDVTTDAPETDTETDEATEEFSGSYTTESAVEVKSGGQSITAPGAAVGRRKKAIARVRIVPGSGTWVVNGRSLEDYFPNKIGRAHV